MSQNIVRILAQAFNSETQHNVSINFKFLYYKYIKKKYIIYCMPWNFITK